MIQYLGNVVGVVTVVVVVLVVWYAVGARKDIRATLADRQQHADGSVMLTFILPNKTKLSPKIGQQILIKTTPSQAQGHQFTPIQTSKNSFKILVIPSMTTQSANTKTVQQLQQLDKNKTVYVSIAKNDFKYVGDSEVWVRSGGNGVKRKFGSFYVVAEGTKVTIAYQILKGICEEKVGKKPFITVLFVGSGIADFPLRSQFEHLQQNYDNVKYYYSLPVKGQRQPSIGGMGISSQKVSESFDSEVDNTFCIICAESGDLSVTVERALLNKKVPIGHIYKY